MPKFIGVYSITIAAEFEVDAADEIEAEGLLESEAIKYIEGGLYELDFDLIEFEMIDEEGVRHDRY